jgi:hypothetical protein
MTGSPIEPPSDLPPYLLATEPMEIEDLPLQVALLTMEIAALRQEIARLAAEIRGPDDDGG